MNSMIIFEYHPQDLSLLMLMGVPAVTEMTE